MAVRAKLQLDSITNHANSDSKSLKFYARYDETIPEDRRFAKATPSAELTMYVDNPAALEQFEIGASYYVDFTPVPKSVPAGTGG